MTQATRLSPSSSPKQMTRPLLERTDKKLEKNEKYTLLTSAINTQQNSSSLVVEENPEVYALKLLNFSPKNMSGYIFKINSINKFLEKNPHSPFKAELENIVQANPYKDWTKASLDKATLNLSPKPKDVLLAGNNLNDGNGVRLKISIPESAEWERSLSCTFFRTAPSIARNFSKQQIDENEDSLINYYHTRTHFKLASINIETNKSRCAAVHTKTAAAHYVIKMLLLNRNNNEINIIDSRYMSAFDNYTEGLIDTHTNLIQEIINEIAPNRIIIKIKLEELIKKYSLVDNDNFIFSNLPGELENKSIQFIPLILCPNNIAGVGFGFVNDINRDNLKKVLKIFSEELNLSLIVKAISNEEAEISKLWFRELTEIKDSFKPYNYSINNSFFLSTIYKVVGLTLVCTAVIVATAILIVSLPFTYILKIEGFKFKATFFIISSGFLTVAKAIYEYHPKTKYISGEKAYYTDFLITCLSSRLGITTSSGCKSNKDRGSGAQIIEAALLAVFSHRAQKAHRTGWDVQDYSILDFKLKNEEERALVRRVCEQNIPFLVTECNTHIAGSKSLEGINYLIEQDYPDQQERTWIKKFLRGLR